MTICVAIFDKTMAYGDDGWITEFTANDPDVGKFISDWANQESFDHAEVWVTD